MAWNLTGIPVAKRNFMEILGSDTSKYSGKLQHGVRMSRFTFEQPARQMEQVNTMK